MPGEGSGFGWVVLGEDPRVLSLGGLCVPLEAAEALNVGDAVYISAANRVSKGATANRGARCGVVVGGIDTRFDLGRAVGTAAASAAGDIVHVCFAGVAEVVSNAVIAAGDRLVFGSTAGRVGGGNVLSVDAGATPVTSSAANGDIISGSGESQILGMALTAAAGAGETVRALLLSA